MRTLQRDAGKKLWTQYWRAMTESWLKIEVLPDYSGEDHGPSYGLWLEGKREESIKLLKSPDNEWRKMCRAKTTQGVRLRRVRLLETPQTAYTQWELQHYKWVNIPGGEQVSVINRNRVRDLDLPNGDVMVFDYNQAVQWTYDKTGRVVSGTFYDQQDEQLAKLRNLILTVMSRARPLNI